MARIRSLHPGLWTDEAFVSVSPMARLLFIGLWNECDDGGGFEWKSLQLKMRILPADNTDVDTLLEELLAANLVAVYEVDGRKYGAVRNFGRFQNPKLPNRRFPMPDDFRSYAASTGLTSGNGHTPPPGNSGSLPKHFRSPSENGEQTGEGRGKGDSPPLPPPPRGGKRFRNGFLAVIEAEGMPSQDPVAAFTERFKRVASD